MKTRALLPLLLAAALVLAGAPARATTWGTAKALCPVCGQTHTYARPMSYGGYIYKWPSRFQILFWPATDTHFVYSCPSCGYSAFMPDFSRLPKDKAGEAKKLLPPKPPFEGVEDYTEIPVPERMALAFRTYSLFDKDQDFWCWFYRIQAWHLDREGRAAQAAEPRHKALALAGELAKDPALAHQKKEYLSISGAMRYFLGDREGAFKDFSQARKLTYRSHSPEELKRLTGRVREEALEVSANYDRLLDGLLDTYMETIQKGGELPQ